MLYYLCRGNNSLLYSIINIHKTNKGAPITTGEVYSIYEKICNKINLRILTQRRVSDIIQELDMLGIITAKVIYKGRYGRSREIYVNIQDMLMPKIDEILHKDLDLK